MNLYRSFGNLLEAWVAEDVQSSAPQEGAGLGCQGPDGVSGDATLSGRTRLSKADLGTCPWSESEDSGLEMASSETSLPSPSCSGGSTDQATSVRRGDEDAGSWSPPPLSPVLPLPSSSSSSSLSLSLSRVQAPQESPRCPQERSEAVHLKLEQRTDPGRWQGTSRTGQRSGGQGLRRKVNAAAACQQASERHKRDASLYLDTLPVQTDPQGNGGEVRQGLGPGLEYLEQVCRMVEWIAKLQIHNRALEMEMDALRELQDKQERQTTSESHQRTSKVVDEDESSSTSPRLEAYVSEDVSSHTPLQIDVFRQRSASDTQALRGHLRKQKMNSRGQYQSAEDLLEQAEDEEEINEITKETEIKSKMWKLSSWKFGSLGRGERTRLSDSEKNSQQTQSSGKKARLGQLFRRRKKIVPA